jgi:hypothetical protein
MAALAPDTSCTYPLRAVRGSREQRIAVSLRGK